MFSELLLLVNFHVKYVLVKLVIAGLSAYP
nr:MAG TPA: hypothetical protein [Caudovirales sp. ct8Ze27]